MDMDLQDDPWEDLIIKIEEPDVKSEPPSEDELLTEDLSVKQVKNDSVMNSNDCRLTSVPIVYTTRLDEMQVFNNSFTFKQYKNVIKQILKESKPKYKNQRILHKRRFIDQFNVFIKVGALRRKAKLENHVRNKIFNANITISTEVYLKNAKLLKQCKTCSIVLERLDLLDYSENGVIKCEKIMQQKKLLTVKNYVPGSTHCLILEDNATNETDIYYVEDGAVTEYHKEKNTDKAVIMNIDTDLKDTVQTKTAKVCCWHKREKYINSLCSKTYPQSVRQFIRKPHTCPHSKCSCCCKSSNEITNSTATSKKNERSIDELSPILPEDLEIKDLEQEISASFSVNFQQNNGLHEYGYNTNWLQDLLIKNGSETLVINKALNYTRPTYESKGKVEDTKTCQHFRLYHNKKTPFVADIYELGNCGNIDTYLRGYLGHEPKKKGGQIQNILDKFAMTHPVARTIKTDIICCWFKREKLIKEVIHTSKNLARFMKYPHTCPLGNCNCCCRSIPCMKLTSEEINLPNRSTPIHTVNVTKMCKSLTNKNKPSSSPSTKVVQVSPYTVPVHTSAVKNVDESDDVIFIESSNTHSHQKSDLTTQTKKLSMENIVRSREMPPSSNVPSALLTLLKTNPSKQSLQANVKVMPNQPHPQQSVKTPILPLQKSSSNNTVPEATAVDSMITSVLDRFKDVRLTINKEGKVAAALNAPVNTLSTAELKVLANILAHAQKQVKVIGLAPGTSITAVDLEQMKIPQVEAAPQKCFTESAFQTFADISLKKQKSLMSSYSSYLSSKQQDTSRVPIITNVFSLKDTQNIAISKSEMSSTLNLWTDKSVSPHDGSKIIPPTSQSCINDLPNQTIQINVNSKDNNAPKRGRTVDDEPQIPGKIRVVDPTKLGLSSSFSRLTDSNNQKQFSIFNDILPKPTEKIPPWKQNNQGLTSNGKGSGIGSEQAPRNPVFSLNSSQPIMNVNDVTVTNITNNPQNQVFSLNSSQPSRNINDITVKNITNNPNSVQMPSGTVFHISNIETASKGNIVDLVPVNAVSVKREPNQVTHAKISTAIPPPLVRLLPKPLPHQKQTNPDTHVLTMQDGKLILIKRQDDQEKS